MKYLHLFIITLILSFIITLVTYSQAWKSGSSRLYANHTSTKIGIGTSSPAYLLHVQGSEYGPASLEEVEKYIKINKHFPEVPSAEEFKKNGYSVGDMDDLLL